MPQEILYQFIINLTVAGQLVISGLVFLHPLPKKDLYPLRLFAAFIIDAVILIFAVMLRIRINLLPTRFIMRLMQFAMPLVISLMCYKGSLFVKLRLWCAGIAAMEIGVSIYSMLLFFLGTDERTSIAVFGENMFLLNWLLFVLVRVVVYLLTYRFLALKTPEELDRPSRKSTTLLSLVCILFLTVPDCVSAEFRAASYEMYLVNKVYLLALAAFILAICTSIEFQSRYRADMEIMDQVLREERKQYEKMKENMDVINMRCHDLRHQLDDFSGKLTDSEIESLRESMDFYDSNLKTGCEVLDVVLHTSKLTAKEYGIEITCLADGGALGFMRTRHLYSLFNNAIGNAIEAVKKLSDPEKRVISITVERQGGDVVIEVTNFYDGRLVTAGETTKKDRSHHGFGTMSMKYIAESYGGSISINTEGEIYCLKISVPLPEGF